MTGGCASCGSTPVDLDQVRSDFSDVKGEW